ncbi:hypothetical protein [Shouchella patagoniensis]|uniref:hypothetical protein n=1 Tax=Shouchella patagoniensis TaxID=228576 RepID=UPI0009953563|nr:hypothetical protein [Shouchella patagoniensis]
MAEKKGINVPIGPAIAEYGEGADLSKYEITKGGITLTLTYTQKDTTVDQYGDTPVKSIVKGLTAQVTVPFALNDLKKLGAVMPNSTYKESGDKKLLSITGLAGYDLLANAKPLVIKPTDPDTTENDWVTIPLAGAMANVEYTYDSDNERIANITFMAYVDTEKGGLLVQFGDTSIEDEGSGGGGE